MPQARPAARLAYHAAAERRASRASGERARDRTRRRRADYSNAPADFGKARSLTRLTATFGTMSACTPPRCRYRCTARRTVEDVVVVDGRNRKQSQGIKVRGDVLTTDPQTNFPIFGAMGFEVTQGLIIGKNTLLVERPSDILHLQAVSSVLRKQKRAFLDPAWAICPAGGIRQGTRLGRRCVAGMDSNRGLVTAGALHPIQDLVGSVEQAHRTIFRRLRTGFDHDEDDRRVARGHGDGQRDRRRPQSAEDLPSLLACDASASLYAANRPLEKVVNRAPRARHQRFGYGEAVRLAKGAWRAGIEVSRA